VNKQNSTIFAAMLVFPNAKVNLGLEVLRRRDDGYHDIDTVMIPVPLRDALEFVPAAGAVDQYYYSGIPIPEGASANTVQKALELLRADFAIPPLDIYLHKAIPTGAGMGGGSADGAFMLAALNSNFNLGIDMSSLEGYASGIGSDCAFFIQNAPARATGRGEILEKINLNLSGYFLLVVYPGLHISTAQAYAKMVSVVPEYSPADIVLSKPIEQWRNYLINRFETYAFENFPAIARLRDAMYGSGALYAAMTGSGSAVFGIFGDSSMERSADIAGICSFREMEL
jgi:4-diphosphocytidyl-2-C-methyl-D-erythritol kinase